MSNVHTQCAEIRYIQTNHEASCVNKGLVEVLKFEIFMYYPIIVHMTCCGGLLNVMFCATCTMCIYIIEYNNLKLKQCELTTRHQIISCVYLK